jgi:hypothetical protein
VEWIWTSLIAAPVRRLLPKDIRSALLEYPLEKTSISDGLGSKTVLKIKTVCIIKRNLRGPDTP